jgi:UDP-N-acetylglucosamine 2-epimerase (non-hydrolysing)
MQMKKYWIIVGTRPEVIKQVPLYLELVQRYGKDQVKLIGTGQHRELLEQALSHFGVPLDLNLEIMRPHQSLSESSSAILNGMNLLFQSGRPDWLVVQGDTTSAAMAAWAGFQSGVRIAHNEAGLRSYDLENPFPEEANRKLISIVADLHFAPTSRARAALLREGVQESRIHTTGNTGIDALKWTLDQPRPSSIDFVLHSIRRQGLKPVLLTAHRRENGSTMDQWFMALKDFLRINPHLGLVYPLHPNHLAKPAADAHLSPLPQVHLMPALNYGETCHLLSECEMVVTDSGGIQEEAATLGVPTVICRKTTERMEAVDLGIARLAGTEPDTILSAMAWAQTVGRAKGTAFQNTVFGDGRASARIADLI